MVCSGFRCSGYTSNNGIFYMLSDHLKSTSALAARNGVLNVRYFYYPYGARRGVQFNSITAKRYTGQYHEASLPGGEGLSFYNARWYDPKLGAFLSADSIVPAPLDPQSFNRYAYAGGNPLRFSDPSGHTKLCGAACEDGYKWSPTPKKGPVTGGQSNNSGMGSGTSPGSASTQSWWIGASAPSIQSIRPGGRYGTGQITYGSRTVSVYRPQTVLMFPGAGFYPRYHRPLKGNAYLQPAGTMVADDWWGEPCPDCISSTGFGGTKPNQWREVQVQTRIQGPTPKEIFEGFAMGYANSPESLPPESDSMRSELRADLFVEAAYAANGALQAGRQNIYVLQVNSQSDYRVIILTKQFSDSQWRYATVSGNVPIGPLPFCTDLSTWR